MDDAVPASKEAKTDNASESPKKANDTKIEDVVYGAIDPKKIVKNYPWAVKDCNNTLEIHAHTLIDDTLVKDYINREEAHFIMDVRYIRKYTNNTESCPEEVIKLSEITEIPSILPGSESCLMFKSKRVVPNLYSLKYEDKNFINYDGDIHNTKSSNLDKNKTEIELENQGKYNKNTTMFSMCLESKDEAELIIKAFIDFQVCRINGKLENYNVLKLEKLLSATCNSIPKRLKEAEQDDFNYIPKDVSGKVLPRVNASKVKEFFKKELKDKGVSGV